ncbi:MAG: CocE/NonD family hydrolase, partial [Myxococcota bacterium]
ARGQLLHPQCELFDPDPDVLCEYGVKVPVDGDTVLTANVFRSKNAEARGEPLPVVMCAHPYDNRLTPHQGNTPLNGPPQQYRLIPQEGRPRFSTLTSWESPDPDFWVKAGYAVVNLNLPGYADSGGPPSVFSDHQARCYHDAIEWVAKQPWCTGRVGLNGVSFLAISQYGVASGAGHGTPPPSLRCISPWEGLSDPYRDTFAPGGLTETGFPSFWWTTEVKTALAGDEKDFLASEGTIPPKFVAEHPTYDDWWQGKAAKLEAIKVPMLVCASFSDHNLHTVGSFRAFMRAGSDHKWVYTHRGGKWDAYYSKEVQELTRRFMDRFLKDDESNGFMDTPPVRLEVRKSLNEVHEVRPEQTWPLARTRYEKLYLSQDATLRPDPVESEGSLEMNAKKGDVRFRHIFAEPIELTGYMSLRLWIELEKSGPIGQAPDDIGLFVYVQKLDATGEVVPFRGSVGSTSDPVTRGYCRGSFRDLDDERSTAWRPVPSGRDPRPLAAGEPVVLDIALDPSSTWFDRGEGLELIVATHEVISSPPYHKDVSFNRGRCRVRMGGPYDAALQIPRV